MESFQPKPPAATSPEQQTAPPGQPAVPPLPYKGVGRRFLALLVDTILLALVLFVSVAIYGAQSGNCQAHFWIGINLTVNGSQKYYGLCGYPALLFFIFSFGYFVVLEWLISGTLGKRMTGLRVTTLAGDRISLTASLIRNLIRVIDVLPGCIPYLVGAILIWTSNTKQRLGDRAAGTVVI